MNLRTPLVLLLCFVALLPLFAQDDESSASAAPEKDIFSLEGNISGMLTNSVNTFSGEVSFSLPLVSLPGRGGLNASVSLFYNSAGVEQMADIWNREAPTSIIGLGWQINLPKIVVDHKQTGIRDDDIYYLVEGGSSSPLILIEIVDGIRHYQTKTYQLWKIAYEVASERWTVTKDNGMQYIYGDKDSDRNTVQYLIAWGNWLGNSSHTQGRTLQAVQWDLSSIQNQGGDQTHFTYQHVKKAIRGAASDDEKRYTQASYLHKITNPQQQTIKLVYENKKTTEYEDPHQEYSEPDAFQERYERKALDKVEVRDAKGSLSYYVDLQYDRFLERTQYVKGTTIQVKDKRLLTSIQKFSSNGSSLPAMRFTYEGTRKGAISQITTPQGGTIDYTYSSGVTSNHSKRDITIEAQVGYAEPQTWIGPDYVVVAWRKLGDDGEHTEAIRKAHLSVYTWIGRWVETPLADIYQVALENGRYKDFQVVVNKDFFGVKHGNEVKLYHKSDQHPGRWSTDRKFFTEDDKPSALLMGNEFVAIGARYNDTGKTKVWRWIGDRWKEKVISLPKGKYTYTAASNYMISHNEVLSPSYNMTMHYLDESKKWRQKAIPLEDLSLTFNLDPSVWYGAHNFAVAMINGKHGVIFHWDENYNFSVDKTTLGSWNPYPTVLISNGTVAVSGAGKGKAVRFDGQEWKATPQFDMPSHRPSQNIAVGEDFVIYNKGFNSEGNPEAGRVVFDSNTNEWKSTETFVTNANKLNTNVTNNTMKDVTSGVYLAGDAYQLIDGELLYRGLTSSWYSTSKLHFSKSNNFWKSSNRLLAFIGSTEDEDKNYGLRVAQIRNGRWKSPITVSHGSIYSSIAYTNEEGYLRATPTKPSQLMAYNTLVTFSGPRVYMTDANQLHLHQFVNDHLEGKQTVHPVTAIYIKDGERVANQISYRYEPSSATVSPEGTTAQFNEVITTAGSYTRRGSLAGYNKTYFFSLLDSDLASEPYTSRNYAHTSLIGTPYKSRTYDKHNSIVAESETQWETYDVPIKMNFQTVAIAMATRILKQTQQQDGMSSVTNYLYNSDRRYPSQVLTTDSKGRTNATVYQYPADFRDNEYGSDLLKERNILSVALTQRTQVGGAVTSQAMSTYTLENGWVLPTRVEQSFGENSEVNHTTYRYDEYGNTVQIQQGEDIPISRVWGYQHSLPVAEVVGRPYQQVKIMANVDALQNLDGEALQDALDPLRTAFSDARVTTYTYDPLRGKTSVTDPSGLSVFYEYDDWGRNSVVRDHHRRIISRSQYHYANQ